MFLSLEREKASFSIKRSCRPNNEVRSCLCKKMDTAAYLTNLGWRGKGHALHHSGRGIIKPVHISNKANVLGVGKKQHDAHADQWWARAFDDTLKGLNTTKDKTTRKTEVISVGCGVQALQMVGIGGAKWIGQRNLYSNFVKGESLNGTLLADEKESSETQTQSENLKTGKKQKRSSNDVDFFTAEAKHIEQSKRNRRLQEVDSLENSRLVGNDTLQQDSKNVGTEMEYEISYARPEHTEAGEERRQRKREKKARKALEASEGGGLVKRARTSAINDDLTSNKRNKEKLHTARDTDLVAKNTYDVPPHRNKKAKRGKRQRAEEFKPFRV